MSPPVEPAAAYQERLCGQDVYFTESERAFIFDTVRRVNGTVGKRRVYGEVIDCEGCGRRCFRRNNARANFCSRPCSKRAGNNPLRKRQQRKPSQSCDKWFSLIVRSVGSCVECGAQRNLQCAHGFSRRYRPLRWDERNAWCLCRGCHVYYTHRPLEWEDWMRRRMGDDLYEELRAIALTGPKPDLMATLERLWNDPRAVATTEDVA